jgi:flagellar protein FliO/FliZ
MTLSPRHKLIGAALLALVAPLIAAAQGASAATAARVLLGLTAAGGIAFWFIRARGGLGSSSKFKAAPRLNVVQRVGLSQRTGLALIEIDGKPYLVVHGDGFAKVSPTRRPARVALRNPKLPAALTEEEEGAPS